MTSEKSLNALREEIDAIDDSLHDLIMRRTEVVEKVRKVKIGEKIKIRPAREAEILYRLMSRHKGPFPKRELCRMWRELIVATLSMEGPFSMAVFMPEGDGNFRDLARDQYGSFTPMTGYAAERRVIEAVGSRNATVGILPMPREDDPDPWWQHLVNENEMTPRIIARLPFAGAGNYRDKDLEALVICPVAHHPVGRDRSYLAVETAKEITLSRLGEAFAGIGLPLVSCCVRRNAQPRDSWLYLAETNEYVADDDRRITSLADLLPLTRVVLLGGYAIPLSETELD